MRDKLQRDDHGLPPLNLLPRTLRLKDVVMFTQSLVSRLSSPDTMLAAVLTRSSGRGASWPNPEQSVGPLITKVGKDSIWRAQGEAQEAFKCMSPDIKTHLDQCIEPSKNEVDWSMYMMGRLPNRSSPTIIFCCEEEERRRMIQDVVQNSGILDRYTGIKTWHMPSLPGFGPLILLNKGAGATDSVASIGFEWAPPVSSGITPAMSLTIRRITHGETSFSKATIGGMICIREQRFYTTAAHAIIAITPSDEGTTHYEDGDCQSDDTFSFDGSEEWGSTPDISSAEAREDTTEEKECDENIPLQGSHLQDLPSPLRGNLHEQPQRAAAVEFDYQGKVYVAQQDDPGALDYALIQLVEDDPRHVNMVGHGDIDAQEPLAISKVVQPPSQDVSVLLITCHGILAGRVVATPVYSLAPGGTRFQKMLSAAFEGPLEKGDCGSWVIDSCSGDLYGHLVAGSPISGNALLVPFIDIVYDIQARDRILPHLPVAHIYEPALKPSEVAKSVGKKLRRFESAEDNTPTVSVKGKGPQRDAAESVVPRDLDRTGSSEGQTIENWARSMTIQFEIIMRAQNINKARSLHSCLNQGEGSSQIHPPSYASIQALRDHMSHRSQAAERQAQHSNSSGSIGSDRYQHASGSGSTKGTAVHSPGTATKTTDNRRTQNNPIARPSRAPPPFTCDLRTKSPTMTDRYRPPRTRSPTFNPARASMPVQGYASWHTEGIHAVPTGHYESNVPRAHGEHRGAPSTTVTTYNVAKDPMPRTAHLREPSRSPVLSSAKVPAPLTESNSVRFRNLLIFISDVPLTWENPILWDEARGVIPLRKIHSEAEEESQVFARRAASLSDDQKPEWDYGDCTVRALLRWFKRSFFTWVTASPACPVCSSPTVMLRLETPTDEERGHGAHRVELYQCSRSECGAFDRFPRYTDTLKLLRTRRGRVGEWTSCFGMMCRAIGARVRWVWTTEDHVWTEVYSEHGQRWVHVDACEEAWDEPLLYTDRLGKRLSYAIAFSVDGAVDVTRRYVRSMDKALPRLRCSESALLCITREIRYRKRAKLGLEDRLRLEREDSEEERELRCYIVAGIAGEVPKSWLLRPSRPTDSLVAEANDDQGAGRPQTDDDASSTVFIPEALPWDTQSRV